MWIWDSDINILYNVLFYIEFFWENTSVVTLLDFYVNPFDNIYSMADKMEEKVISNLGCFLRGFKEGFLTFGLGVNLVINTALMILVYICVVGPTSLASKTLKKEFLDMDKKTRDSYWEKLQLRKKDLEEYYRQY